MKTMTAFAAVLIFALLVACGPASQTEQNGGGRSDTPIAAGNPQQGGEPVAPTATPEPPTPEPPAVTDATATPKPPPPTPITHPDDKEPQSTSTPDRGDLAPLPNSPALTNPPVPEAGISACYGINQYNTTIEEFGYMEWCHEALVNDVVDNCSGTGDSIEELTCARQRLTNVEMYYLREALVPCSAITDEADRLACAERTATETNEHVRTHLATWAEILHTVDSQYDVKSKKTAMSDCVAEKGYERPDSNDPVSWQENNAPDEGKTLRGEPEDVRAASIARLQAIDECAADVGLYAAQEAAWMVEISRLNDADPEKVKPLMDNGIVEALKADGIASFLMPAR